MENALVLHQAGVVTFDNYEKILAEAQELADYVSSVEVTEDSVKATKKLLASVNKKVNELEDGRKAIKRDLLAPYEEFEKKIKTITKVVKDADSIVRDQVKELEEKEREEKRLEIFTLFHKRMNLYPTLTMFKSTDFIRPNHLLKSISMNSIEQEMVSWFEHHKKTVELIKTLDNGEDVLIEYINTLDPVSAIQIVKDRNKKKEELTGKKEINDSITIAIDRNDFAPVEAFMKSLNINYQKTN